MLLTIINYIACLIFSIIFFISLYNLFTRSLRYIEQLVNAEIINNNYNSLNLLHTIEDTSEDESINRDHIIKEMEEDIVEHDRDTSELRRSLVNSFIYTLSSLIMTLILSTLSLLH